MKVFDINFISSNNRHDDWTNNLGLRKKKKNLENEAVMLVTSAYINLVVVCVCVCGGGCHFFVLFCFAVNGSL